MPREMVGGVSCYSLSFCARLLQPVISTPGKNIQSGPLCGGEHQRRKGFFEAHDKVHQVMLRPPKTRSYLVVGLPQWLHRVSLLNVLLQPRVRTWNPQSGPQSIKAVALCLDAPSSLPYLLPNLYHEDFCWPIGCLQPSSSHHRSGRPTHHDYTIERARRESCQ